MSACLSKDPAARPTAALLARALRDPALLREATLHGHAAGDSSTASPWGPGAGSYDPTYVPPTAGVAQIFTGLQPGTEYELTGWIYSGTGGYYTYVGAKAYDSTAGVSRTLNTASTWLQVSMVFTPAAGHTTADVWCWQAVTGTGYCTDVSLRALS